jgi:hypothetical protein
MKLAVMQVCPPFLWAHLATGPLAESNNIYSSTTSANLRQDEYLADIETFVSGEADIGSSANISSAFYHPSNLGTEVDLGDEFPIEEAFQGCNWDNLECSVADLAWKNDIEEKAPQPMTNAITDNLTLEFPEPFDQSAISMLQLHFPVPTLTKQDLGFSSLEIAAADVLDKQIPSEMNTAHETGVGLSHQHDNSPSCRRRDYG